MTTDLRDAGFVATVARERPMLLATAYLLVDDPGAAADLVDGVLAHLYVRGVPAAALRLEGLRALVGDDPRLTSLPWRRAARFELVEREARPPLEPIVADLARLSREQRTVLVLTTVAALPVAEVAGLLNRPVEDVALVSHQAMEALATGHDTRNSHPRLTAELQAAVPAELYGPPDGFADLGHGQRLIRRRRLRRGVSVAAALLVAIVLVGQLWPRAEFVPSSAPPITNLPSVSTPTPRASCDTEDPVCRATILREWRAEMARVAGTYLDPDRRYFSGYAFSYDDRYESTDVWSGRGVLGLDLFRMQSGGTEVYLQIATSRRFAVHCGTTTHNACVSQRFMDGNRFTLTDSTAVAQGVEVQYSPDGDQVITVVARNVNRGQELPITRGDLINLVEDPRLRLPAR